MIQYLFLDLTASSRQSHTMLWTTKLESQESCVSDLKIQVSQCKYECILAKSPSTSGLYFSSLMRSPETSTCWGLFNCLIMSGLWAGVSVILVAALSIISSCDNVEKQEARLAKTMFFMYLFFNLKETPSPEVFLGRICPSQLVTCLGSAVVEPGKQMSGWVGSTMGGGSAVRGNVGE